MDNLANHLALVTPAPSDDFARPLCLEIVRRVQEGPEFSPPELEAITPFYAALSHQMRLKLHRAVFRTAQKRSKGEDEEFMNRVGGFHRVTVREFLEVFGTKPGEEGTSITPVIPSWTTDGSLGEL